MGRGSGQAHNAVRAISRTAADDRSSVPAPSASTSAAKGSPLVVNGTVSRAVLDGRHGMQTGIWFHVTPSHNEEVLRRRGILNADRSGYQHAARWADPNAVYVWPDEAAARDWVDYRREGGYGGRRESRYEILAINARPDEVTVCPDNEEFGGFLSAWMGTKNGESWPDAEESESADFYQTLRSVSADGVTLEQWLDDDGQDTYWRSFDEIEEFGEDADDRIIASDLVRVMPPALRAAVCEHYAANGRALMLLSSVPPSRVIALVP